MKSQTNFIKSDDGTYTLANPVSEREIIDQASDLLFQEIQRDAVTSSTETKRFFALKLAAEDREHLAVLYLDARHKILHFAIEFSGTIDRAPIFPRVILEKALKLGQVSAVVIAHNHPSGSLEFSMADRNISKEISKVLDICDIRLLDSILVTREGTLSMAERGIL